MRVQGVDPVVINRIQEKVQQKAVQETDQVVIAPGGEQERKKEKKRSGKQPASLIKQLNAAVGVQGLDLLFLLDASDPEVVVVTEKSSGKLIARLPFAQVESLLPAVQRNVGFLLDYYL
ncbi:MAG TPA: hypothetical protein GX699_05460 [Firmicutes bacterium]|nr:hypothetical protein [Bacillota bacterium]